jgi:hypothetical protein
VNEAGDPAGSLLVARKGIVEIVMPGERSVHIAIVERRLGKPRCTPP